MHKVGSVPFVNAKPLVDSFERAGEDSPVQVVYDLPSKLPALLQSGSVEAILVSSYDALATPGRRIASDVCIGTRGPAESVRLFSKNPIEQIETLALDESSMTSNALCLLILKERYGIAPTANPQPPILPAMLKEADAALLIGDRGMTADGEGLTVLDLGQEWLQLTGLPFVWALWVGGEEFDPALVGRLIRARDDGLSRIGEIVDATVKNAGWSEESARRYLTQTMNYSFGEDDMAGLKEFARRLGKAGLLTMQGFPEIIFPEFSNHPL